MAGRPVRDAYGGAPGERGLPRRDGNPGLDVSRA